MRTRVGLLAPWLLLAALAVGVYAAWVSERKLALEALDRAPTQASALGLKLALGRPEVSGFPFRLRVRSAAVSLEAPNGWAASAPELVAQAYVFAPRKWVLVAPSGVTVRRPQGGAFDLQGQALRASVSRLGLPGWLLVLQADAPVLTPARGGRPVALSSAARIDLDAKAAAQPGETSVLLQVDKGVAAPESALWLLASGVPFDAAVSGRLARGALQLDRVAGQAGPLSLASEGAELRAGADGALDGELPIRISPAAGAPPPRAGTPAALALARAKADGGASVVTVVFAGGKAKLAPAAPTP